MIMKSLVKDINCTHCRSFIKRIFIQIYSGIFNISFLFQENSQNNVNACPSNPRQEQLPDILLTIIVMQVYFSLSKSADINDIEMWIFKNILHKTEHFEKFLKQKIKRFHLNYSYINGSTALVTLLA